MFVRFGPAFPGLVPGADIYARNTYDRTLTLTSMTSSDVRVVPELKVTQLPPGERVCIGSVVFDAARLAVPVDHRPLRLHRQLRPRKPNPASGIRNSPCAN